MSQLSHSSSTTMPTPSISGATDYHEKFQPFMLMKKKVSNFTFLKN